MIKKIYLDMDGVLADFVTAVEGPDYLNGPLHGEQTYDDRKIEFTNKRLFRNMPPMPGMLDLVAYVKGSNLPTLKGKHKAIFARPGHVLVDDKKSNIVAWENAGGIGILHETPAGTIKKLQSL